MSAFLGPIHYWLYNKISLQEKMVESILSLNEEKNYVVNLSQEVDEQCGFIEKKPLEEMIDTMNIHGWLQDKVSIVERRLSFVVTTVLKQNPEYKESILDAIYELGVETYEETEETLTSPEDVYKKLNDILLDGMPCDHVNELLSVSESEVVYRRTVCIHESYWNEKEGLVENYYDIRCKFIEGFLSKTPFSFETENDYYYIRVK